MKSVENILPKPLSWKGTNFATVGRSHFKRTILWKIVSYASSDHETLCRSSCIACRQKVSRRCVKACDTSYYCSDCKNSCTVYKQRAFLQCEWACESSDFEIEWRNSHTAHNWKASLLNGFTCKSYYTVLFKSRFLLSKSADLLKFCPSPARLGDFDPCPVHPFLRFILYRVHDV